MLSGVSPLLLRQTQASPTLLFADERASGTDQLAPFEKSGVT
jgi:hypothetical protein